MKKRRNNSHRASTLQIALSTGLISIFAILLAIAAPANRKEVPRQNLSGFQLKESADALGNYPDTSVPLSGDTTVTPDAAPTNTTSINVSTSTNFKGTFAASPTTGVVRVIDAHPAGIYTVTVTAFGPGGATTKAFTLTITSGTSCDPNGFTEAAYVNTGVVPLSVAIGDFNGDGKQDLAVADQNSGAVTIHLGNGLGGFSGPTYFGVGSDPHSVAIGDFNGDGKQDLAVANEFSNTISIRLGDGLGGFSGSTEVSVGSRPLSVAIGDFNGDGKQDLAVTNRASNTVSIRLGDGSGGFNGSTEVSVGTSPLSVAIGDFNGDGKQDLAVACWSDGTIISNTVSIRLGDGLGGFSGSANFNGGSPYSVAIGDFNGDGKQDLAVANFRSNTVSIRLGDGLGGFSGSTTVSVNGNPVSVAIGDFNGDGNQDLAVANYRSQFVFPHTVSIRLGDGLGGFSGSDYLEVDQYPESVAIGDFNGDGRQDLAIANSPTNRLAIRLGQQCTPVPTPTPSPTPTATATATATIPPPTPTPSPGICGTILYDQTSNAGNSATNSQNFEAANDAFDNQGADDFVVPAGPVWTVQRVNVNGFYFNGDGPVASFNVTFYFDSATFPGAVVPGGAFTNLAYTQTGSVFSMALPSNLVLSSGTYWVSVQANMDFTPGGQWGWTDRTVTSNSAAVWQNPGGGFATPCTTYGRRGATCGIDPEAPDQIFQIVGCLGAPSPTPSPTPSATPTPTPCPIFNISGTVGQCTTAGPSGIPLAGVTITRTVSGGGGGGSTTTDQNGNYFLSGFSCMTNTFTPSKAARLPGSAGINTVDVLAVQRHFLNLGTPLSGCRLTAADVNGAGGVNTVDVIATQKFFLGLTSGTANVGKYQFTPASRSYSPPISNQTAQNYDTIVFGDVASPFAAP